LKKLWETRRKIIILTKGKVPLYQIKISNEFGLLELQRNGTFYEIQCSKRSHINGETRYIHDLGDQNQWTRNDSKNKEL